MACAESLDAYDSGSYMPRGIWSAPDLFVTRLAELPFPKAFENTIFFSSFPRSPVAVKRFFQVGQERVLKQSVNIMTSFTYNVIKTRREETRAVEVSGTANGETII